jgi:predicted Zn-dependent protease
MSKKSSNKTFQRLIIIASSLALVGSSGVLIIEALLSDRHQSSSQTNTNTAAIEQLKAQAKGYERVLEREPNNSAALQNLAKIRLQLQDYQGAVAPLEKLVELYPKETIFQQLLTQVKQSIQEQKQQSSNLPTDSFPSNKTKP